MTRRRSILLSLPALLAALLVLAGGAQAASAPTLVGLETAVGRSAPLTSVLVGSRPLKPVITPRVAARGYDGLVVATGVAAEDALAGLSPAERQPPSGSRQNLAIS